MKAVFFYLTLVFVLFQNCSQGVDFGKSEAPSLIQVGDAEFTTLLDEDDPDIEIISKSCETLPVVVKDVVIQFPKPQNTCDWNNGGNLQPKDAHFQARIEQKRFLDLPAGAIICDAEFDFPEQEFRYDDYFALLFNDSVISSGYDFSGYLQPKKFGLLEYDWQDLAGVDMNFGSEREQIFCPQIPGSFSQCQFPGHDEAGSIQLNFDPQFIQSIMSNGIPENHSFSLVSFGDNDENDCEHSAIEFSVRVSYVQ